MHDAGTRPSKKHLLLAVAERRFESTSRGWEELEESPGDPDPCAPLIAATERFVSEPGLIQLFILVMSEAAEPASPAHALFSERYTRAVSSLASLLQRRADAGEIRSDIDAVALAQECIAVSDGLQLQWVISDGRLNIVERIRDFMTRLQEQLALEPESDRA